MPKIREVAHIPDIAWIIALWKAIHGGDSGPGDRVAAASLLAEAVAYLNGQVTASVSVSELTGNFEKLGLKLEVSEVDAPAGEQRIELLHFETQYIQVCWGVGAARKCVLVQVPKRQ
jgi:hypothetical protein